MRPPASVLLIVPVAVLVGCSTPDPEASAPTPTQTITASPQSSPTLSPTSDPVVAPTCEELADPELVTSLAESGYVPTASPFEIGDVTLDPGVQCTWVIPDSGTDAHVLQAWGVITDAQAQVAIDALVGEGWVTEPGEEGTYVTFPGGGVQSDAEGYYTTYLFGDGWVTLSDVKAGLAEIVRPVS
ncbi:hypothetical protein [Microbacterium sp. 18062]|uniref:hypothetical protein n=1 Tax=Microbacterium sp. 18062 TaxID=2681410 RepID=UPI00135C499F|nr:hypothetical protein [Microbacterium sp. 18062]